MATTDTISAGTSLADSERMTMTNRNSSAAVALSALKALGDELHRCNREDAERAQYG